MIDYAVNDGHGDVIIVEELAPVGKRLLLVVRMIDRHSYSVLMSWNRLCLACLFIGRYPSSSTMRQSNLSSWSIFFFNSPLSSTSSSVSITQGSVKADFVAGVDGFQANPDGKVRLVDARRTDEDDIVPVVDKAEVEQTVDLPFADGGLEPVIELLQAFVSRKAGPSPVLLDTLAVALLLFMLDQAFGKMQIGAFIGFGLAQ